MKILIIIAGLVGSIVTTGVIVMLIIQTIRKELRLTDAQDVFQMIGVLALIALIDFACASAVVMAWKA